jgi:hypothetical protein
MTGESRTFSEKLELVLKALSMSRGRLAFELEVNKSLVSRWVSGAVTPSSHSLSALTQLIARKRPGFTMLDWDRDTASLAGLFGVDPSALAKPAPPTDADRANGVAFPPETIEAARREIQRRGASYEGLWNGTRPASTMPGVLLRERALIRLKEGVLYMRWGAPGQECRGWLLMQMGQLYGMLVDVADDSMLFCVLNGVTSPRVEAIDGLLLANAKDTVQSPTAQPTLLERVGDLTGDEAADDARYEALKESSPYVLREDEVSPHVRAHLLRDFGPAAHARGGDMLLRLPIAISMSRGGPAGPSLNDISRPNASVLAFTPRGRASKEK